MYIITSKTRSKIRRDPNSQRQLSDERRHFFSESGVEKIQSLKGKTEQETYEEIKQAGSFVKETMQERREKKRAEKQKAWKDNQQKRIKDATQRYIKGKEEKAKTEAKKRKINLS